MIRRLAIALTVATALFLLPAGASASMSTPVPLAPLGFHPDLAPPDGAAVTVTTIMLPPTSCAGLDKTAFPNCQAILRSYGRSFLPLPPGVRYASTSGVLAASYWYWHAYDEICSVAGCWYEAFSLEEDGVADGYNVWEWHVWCTPGGISTSITWCGFNYNGGGWPYYAMQFGLNGQQCLITSTGTACFLHGMRRWIDDYGNKAGFSYW